MGRISERWLSVSNGLGDKCQSVDCKDDARWTEIWRVGTARAFVRVCDNCSTAHTKGSRTQAAPGMPHIEAAADRVSVDA